MLTKDERSWLQEIIKDNAKHQTPSHETRTLIDNLEKNMNRIEAQTKEHMEKILEEITSMRKGADKRYANKWTEQMLKGAVGAILFYFLGGVLGLFSVPMVTSTIDYFVKTIS